MINLKKPGVIVPIVCAAGLSLAALAAIAFGSGTTAVDPIPESDTTETCPNKDGKKTENCSQQFPFYAP